LNRELTDSDQLGRMAASGAEQKHVTLPTDFRSLPETGHSRYGDPTGRVCPDADSQPLIQNN